MRMKVIYKYQHFIWEKVKEKNFMDNRIVELETERLKLRQWRESDFEYFVNYYSDEETARYVGGRKTQEEAWRLLAAYIGHWQLKGYGYMAVEEKYSKRFVGCVGLWKSEPWPELEMGYWLLKDMQGKGYATEATKKVKEFAFKTVRAKTLVSYIAPENKLSRKLAERLGAIHEKTIELLNYGPHCVYRYSKTD